MRPRVAPGAAPSGASAPPGRPPATITPGTQQNLRSMFSAAATNWSAEVGKKIEVKGNWWVGGTTAERSKWHLVTVIEYTDQHEFEVRRKGQPASTRVGKALKIRVDAVDDESDDAWMDVNQYAKYKERYEQKLKDDAIVESARELLKGALPTADDDDGNGGGGGDGSDGTADMTDSQRYKSVIKLLFTDCKEYRPSKTGKSGSWKMRCLLDKGELWEPSLRNKAPTSTSRRSKYIRVNHPRVWAEFIVPISPHVRGRMVNGEYVPLKSFKDAFGAHWLYAKMVAKVRLSPRHRSTLDL